MKNLILFLIVLISLDVNGQTKSDPVISGARQYLKQSLKNPDGYVEYGVVKISHTMKDSIREVVLSLKNEMSSIPMEINNDSLEILRLKYSIEKDECLNKKVRMSYIEYKQKILGELKKQYNIYSSYIDTNEYNEMCVSLKSKFIGELQNELKRALTYLNDYTLSKNVYEIERTKNKIREIENKIVNADSLYKKDFDYTYNRIIGNYKTFERLKNEISKIEIELSRMSLFNHVVDSLIGRESGIVPTYRFYTSGYVDEVFKVSWDGVPWEECYGKSSNTSFFSSWVMNSNTIHDTIADGLKIKLLYSNIENNKIKLINIPELIKDCNKKITELSQIPSKNKIIYYNIIFDYSSTNSYGGRIKDSEMFYYYPKTKTYSEYRL
jgi:hypothetical protein